MPGPKTRPGPTDQPASENSVRGKSVHDGLNRAIIAILQEDGRTPYSTIAATLGVSEGAVRKRVTRLQERGDLRIVAIIEPMALSYDAYTMLGITVAPEAQPEAVAERLALCPDVVYAIWTSGPYDLLVETLFEEKEEFTAFLADQIHGHPDIWSCDAMQSLKVIKNQYYLRRDMMGAGS